MLTVVKTLDDVNDKSETTRDKYPTFVRPVATAAPLSGLYDNHYQTLNFTHPWDNKTRVANVTITLFRI